MRRVDGAPLKWGTLPCPWRMVTEGYGHRRDPVIGAWPVANPGLADDPLSFGRLD